MTTTALPLDDAPASMNVRAFLPHGGTTHRYFPGVSPARAVELARWYLAATCTSWTHLEVRGDTSLYAPVLVTAEA